MQAETSEVTAFGTSAEWTGVRSSEREKWLGMRHTMLTASDVACILGFGRRSAYAVYVDKITPRTEEPEKLELTDPRLWGSALEQPILRTVAGHYGWDYREGGALLRSRAYPWLGATLDAEIDRHDGRGWVDLEGKTSRVTKEWDESERDVPVEVLIQVQSQLLVCGAPMGVVFALLLGSRPCQVDIEPDFELHRLIAEESERFMQQVRTLTPPDVDGHETTKQALSRQYPLDDGSVIQLPTEALDWTRELREIAAQQKELAARESEIKNRLRACIGNATIGVMPDDVDGKRFWRWQLQERKEHTVRASSSRVLLSVKNGPEIPSGFALPEASPLNLVADLKPEMQAEPVKKARKRARR